MNFQPNPTKAKICTTCKAHFIPEQSHQSMCFNCTTLATIKQRVKDRSKIK